MGHFKPFPASEFRKINIKRGSHHSAPADKAPKRDGIWLIKTGRGLIGAYNSATLGKNAFVV